MRAGSLAALGACLGVLAGCHERSEPESSPPASAATPDRLAADERLPEAETAFGLPLPTGMRLVRYYNDAAYFSGELALDAVLEHVRARVRTGGVQMLNDGVLFPRAVVAGVAATATGTATVGATVTTGNATTPSPW